MTADFDPGDAAPFEGTTLRLAVRYLFGVDGERPRRLTVFCPRRRDALDVKDCCTCPRILGYATSVERCSHGALVCFPGEGLSERWQDEDDSAARRTVLDRMATHVVCVEGDVPMDRVEHLFAAFGTRTVIVVDSEDKPVGIVSRGVGDYARAKEHLAGEVAQQTTPIAAWAPVSAAVRRLAGDASTDIPVTGREGEVVGLVSL